MAAAQAGGSGRTLCTETAVHRVPETGGLDSVISYLKTDESSVALDSNDLGVRRVALRIWGPIWSNLVFLAVVLGLACVYIQRKDF